MELDNEKIYLPLSGRLVIPATTTPDSPYRFTLQSQANTLEWIEIILPQTGVLQNLGVRIFGNEGALYPAMGSNADSNFASGKNSFGAMPTSGQNLILPFNRRLIGPPYNLIFEFYNDGAGTVAVNLFAITSELKHRVVIADRKTETAKHAV